MAERFLEPQVPPEIRSFTEHGIFGLKKRIEGLSEREGQVASRIISVQNIEGKTVPPNSMYGFIEKQFGNVERVQNQLIVRVKVRPLMIATLFNILRSSRPGMSGNDARDKEIAEIIERNRKEDVFLAPEVSTPADSWGRIKGKFCTSAANIAKYDGCHSLVIFNEPDPLKFSREQVVDYLMTARGVLEAQHRENSNAKYPFLTWQCLGKAAASQVHGHLQVNMAAEEHYTGVERLRESAITYKNRYGSDFWRDYIDLHDTFGLTIKRNGVSIIAHVAPKKENEIWMVGSKFDEAFASETFDLLDYYTKGLGVRSFTLSVTGGPFDRAEEDWTDFPIILRLVDRGDPTTPTGDMGGMEVYAEESVVSADPYDVKRRLVEHSAENGDKEIARTA